MRPDPEPASPRVRYQTLEVGPYDVHLRTLRDRSQYADPYGEAERAGISSAAWPIFGLLWDSARVLAHHMLELDLEGKRVLEVGCGIALPTLVMNQMGVDITATDRHPEARHFLSHNNDLNPGPRIPFVRADWGEPDPMLGTFDMIVASDVLYERAHVELLGSFVDAHLAKEGGTMILVDPGRSHNAPFSKRMVASGYSHEQWTPEGTEAYVVGPWNGRILVYSR